MNEWKQSIDLRLVPIGTFVCVNECIHSFVVCVCEQASEDEDEDDDDEDEEEHDDRHQQEDDDDDEKERVGGARITLGCMCCPSSSSDPFRSFL